MLFVKINFQIRLESAYLATRRRTKSAREGTASRGREGSCSPSRGIQGGEWATAVLQQDTAAKTVCHSCLQHHAVPSPFLWTRERLSPLSAPRPWAAARQGCVPDSAFVEAPQCDHFCDILYSSKSLLKFCHGNAEQPRTAKWMESRWGKTDRLW